MRADYTLRRLFYHPEINVGILIIMVYLLIAIAAPWIAPPESDFPFLIPRGVGFSRVPQPPSPEHPLGTMPGQHDVLYGLVWGTRVAFVMGFAITAGRMIFGVLLGLISGYLGGLLDAIFMRVTDAFMAFPAVAAAAVILTMFGERFFFAAPLPNSLIGGKNELIVIVTLVVFGWMQYARLIRANILAEREKEYVQAATTIGASKTRILFRHLFPNALQGLFVLVAADIGAMVALIAAFYFVGLIGNIGSDLTADWGHMLSVSRDWIVGTPSNAFEYWYTFLPASLAIVSFTLGWTLIGDGLRDVLDPRTR